MDSIYLKSCAPLELSKGMNSGDVSVDLSGITIPSGGKVTFTVRHMRSREIVYSSEFTTATSHDIIIGADVTSRMTKGTEDYKYQIAIIGSDGQPVALSALSPVRVLDSAGGVC